MRMAYRAVGLLVVSQGLAAGASTAAARIEGAEIRIEFDSRLYSRAVALIGGQERAIGDFAPSDFPGVAGRDITDFALREQKTETVEDQFGKGRRLVLTGSAAGIDKTVSVTVYEELPRMAVFGVRYTNTGTAEIAVEGWTSRYYSITAGTGGAPSFWSYQSGSYEKRPDWILPLKPGFKQANFQGMNAADYGGGTPVVDVWRRDAGIAVGHLELAPKLVSLPVTEDGAERASVAVTFDHKQTLKPGGTLDTFRTFVAVHTGDCFQALRDYRAAMMRQGVHFDPSPEAAYEPIWCAWGYGRKCTPGQVYGALPEVKRLGFGWVTLDDGWQTNQGDWALNPRKYPDGDEDMRKLVEKIHQEGFKAQLWWAPLTADPASKLVREHPDWLLQNASGGKQKISYWNSWYLCPAYAPVVEYHKAIVTKAIRDWGFDGLKLDGQHMNGAPPCYNPAHHHARPEEAVEGMPNFFAALYAAARAAKPEALVEFCPCGTAYSFFTLPYMNMSVASDPESAWQVRTKAKVLKALAGDQMAYFGDHVDLYKDDFASAVGVGGVVGTNFTWPAGSAARNRGDLTAAREKLFEKWLGIYRAQMLSRGEYAGGLYDIGFDRPETHAIRKDGNMYYAFFAPQYSGEVTLRGLGQGSYRVTDYVEGRDLGTVRGASAKIKVSFERHLLIEAKPE